LAYGACDEKSAKHAKRISYWIDADGHVKKAYPNVDAAAHPEQVLADITDIEA
jgi:peroxiredoxin